MSEEAEKAAAIQAARERAALETAWAMAANAFSVSAEQIAAAWDSFSESQQARFMGPAWIALEAVEAAMRKAGFEWLPRLRRREDDDAGS